MRSLPDRFVLFQVFYLKLGETVRSEETVQQPNGIEKRLDGEARAIGKSHSTQVCEGPTRSASKGYP